MERARSLGYVVYLLQDLEVHVVSHFLPRPDAVFLHRISQRLFLSSVPVASECESRSLARLDWLGLGFHRAPSEGRTSLAADRQNTNPRATRNLKQHARPTRCPCRARVEAPSARGNETRITLDCLFFGWRKILRLERFDRTGRQTVTARIGESRTHKSSRPSPVGPERAE